MFSTPEAINNEELAKKEGHESMSCSHTTLGFPLASVALFFQTFKLFMQSRYNVPKMGLNFKWKKLK